MTHRLLAVVTAAGHGTRFRPFAAHVPKEMLPLGGTPAVELVIDECLHAGATEVVVVTRPDDTVITAHLADLHDRGWPVRAVPENLDNGYGNAAPLLTLHDELADHDLFMVAFGDDVLLGEPSAGANLSAMHHVARTSAAALAVTSIPHDQTGSFGIVDVHPDDPARMRRLRQRPDPATVTDPLAVVSRLVLRPTILDTLAAASEAGGEVDLGVAVGRLATTDPVAVHRVRAQWVTVGDPQRYFDALTAYWRIQPPGVPA
ncbi:MAG: NTP transferase domain-containing protein [Pseudonocardia sp.]|nr:NTP transferase domain-containing protein [Pseudonocardia sp.]